MAATPAGGGGNSGTGSVAGTAIVLWGPQKIADIHNQQLVIEVNGNQTFHVNMEFTNDGGTTWQTSEKNASAVVASAQEDQTNNWVNGVRIVRQLGYEQRVCLVPDGGSMNWTAAIRRVVPA